MKRTVTKMGNTSLGVSLPNKWVKDFNVQKGDELFVELLEKSLLISLSEIRKKESEITLEVSKYINRTILNLLNAAYRCGFTTIRVEFKDKNQLNFIKSTVRNQLLGFEIVEENKNKCIIQNIAEPSEQKLEVIIRKIFLIIKQMGEQVLICIKEKDYTSLKSLEESKTTIDNFTNFARRTILSVNYGGKEKSYFLFLIISQLSLINHSYYYFYEKFITSRITKLSPIEKLIGSINQQFNLIYEAFYQKDYSKLDKVSELRLKLHEEILNVIDNRNAIICLLFELVKHIQMTGSYLYGYHLSSNN